MCARGRTSAQENYLGRAASGGRRQTQTTFKPPLLLFHIDMPQQEEPPFRAHWRCLLACTLVSMSPFQYGVDFGIIGGLQAMIGFLEVSIPAIYKRDSMMIDTVSRYLERKIQLLQSDGISLQDASS